MSIFEKDQSRPDDSLYFHAVVVLANQTQIERIKRMLVAQNVKIIYQMTDLGYLWIQRGRPEVKT